MPRSSLLTVLLLTACVGLGALLGLGGLALGFEHLPSEMGRLQLVGASLDGIEEGEAPAAVVLGSSVVMNGIDGAVVAEALPGTGAVWNLSSTGQTLAESALILERPVALPGIVVMTAPPGELITARLTIQPNKYATYRLYGYRPSASLQGAIAAGGDRALAGWMGASQVAVVSQGRWMLRAAFDAGLRRVLRPDLAADRVASDLSFPARYTRPAPPETLRYLLLRQFERSRPAEAAVLAPRAAGLLRYVAEAARADEACLVLVVLPEHPRRRETTEPAFYDALSAQLDALAAETGLQVIDRAAFLDDPAMFYDHVHPSASGAERLSRALGDAIAHACPSEPAR